MIYVTLRQVGVATSQASDGFFCARRREEGKIEEEQMRKGREDEGGRDGKGE